MEIRYKYGNILNTYDFHNKEVKNSGPQVG